MKRLFHVSIIVILISSCIDSKKEFDIDLDDIPLKIEIPLIYDNFLKDSLYPFNIHSGHTKIYFGARKDNWHPLSRPIMSLDGYLAEVDDIVPWYKNKSQKNDFKQTVIFTVIDRDVSRSAMANLFSSIDSLNNVRFYIAVKVINNQNDFEYNWIQVTRMIEKRNHIDSIKLQNKEYYRVVSFEDWINEY